MPKQWKVYMAGEIHSDWRERIVSAAAELELAVTFMSPVTDHAASDNCGVDILGPEASGFWKDHKGAGINAIRTRTLIGEADIVVVRFGDEYRQWNPAFDAGFASALGKPIVVIHHAGIAHALKEVASAALAVAQTPEQVADVLAYVTRET